MQSSLFRSIVSHWLGFAAATLLGLLIIPLVVRSLGDEQYGLWTLITAITAQLALFDLGVRQSVTKYSAEYRARNDTVNLSQLFSSASFVLVIAAFACFFVVVGIDPFFASWFGVSESLRGLATLVLLIAAVDTMGDIIFGVAEGALSGAERYDLLHGVNVARVFVYVIIAPLVLSAGYGLIGFALTVVALRLIHKLLLLHWARREYPGVEVKSRYISKRHLAYLGNYGLWAFVLIVAGRFAGQLSPIVIGASLGTAAVTAYAIPLLLIEHFKLFVQSGSSVVTPRLSALGELSDTKQQLDVFYRWSRLHMLAAIFIVMPLLVTGPSFLELWIGRASTDSGLVLQLLAGQFLLALPAQAVISYLLAVHRHQIAARVLLLEAVVNLALAVVLVGYWGLVGVAIATLIPAVLLRGIIMPWLASRATEFSMRIYLNQTLGRCALLGVGYLGVLLLLRQVFGEVTWINFLLQNALGAGLFVMVVYRSVMDDTEREYLKRRLGF